MVFSSLLFLFRFLPIVLLLYFIVPKRFRNLVLFLSSLVFYAWGEPVYVGLILFSTVLDYTLGRIVASAKEDGRINRAKLAVAGSAVGNLLILGFFKYSNFLIETINSLAGLDLELLDLALPIGISFYTFQTMSYTIDVYRGEAEVQKNLITFGAYVSLFPQLIAGPIVRYQTVAKQLVERQETVEGFVQGLYRFFIGLGKKVLIANQIGALWSELSVTSAAHLSTLGAWLGVLCFSLQIYFDFSGYSDMAIGLGKIFGFTFLENFEHPYESKSVSEFWRRWHISMGTWFREYVYIPLGGNRKGKARQLVNITIVWFLTGLWHGASWNFVLWGMYFAVWLLIERAGFERVLQKLPTVFSHIYTLLIVAFGWLIFSWEDVKAPFDYLRTFFGGSEVGFMDSRSLYLICSNAVLLLIAIIGSTTGPKRIWAKLAAKCGEGASLILEGCLLLGVFFLSVAMLVNSSYNPFLYFRF